MIVSYDTIKDNNILKFAVNKVILKKHGDKRTTRYKYKN